MASINLTGSEKQIAWAMDIINGSLNTIESNITVNQSRKAETNWNGYGNMIKAWETVKVEYEEIISKLDGQAAKVVIDHRDSLNTSSTMTRYERAYRKISLN